MIVLTILKWIGIVLGWTLLGILALALLILLVVLFVPVRYRVGIATTGEKGRRIVFRFHITWILHAISIRKRFADDVTVVRLFGIPIRKIGGDEVKSHVASADEDEPEEDIFDEEFDDEDFDDEASDSGGLADETDGVMPEESVAAESPPEEESEHFSEEKSDGPGEESEEEEEETDVEQDREDTTGEEGREHTEKAKKVAFGDMYENLKKKIRKKYRKIDFLFYKFSSIISFVRARATKKTVRRLLREFVGIIRYVGPRRISGHMEFGTGDPCYTGMVLAVLSLCPAARHRDFIIEPNFEDVRLAGDIEMKGRIRAVHFVIVGLRIWFDKDVHRMWKDYRRMKKDFKKREKQLAAEFN